MKNVYRIIFERMNELIIFIILIHYLVIFFDEVCVKSVFFRIIFYEIRTFHEFAII